MSPAGLATLVSPERAPRPFLLRKHQQLEVVGSVVCCVRGLMAWLPSPPPLQPCGGIAATATHPRLARSSSRPVPRTVCAGARAARRRGSRGGCRRRVAF